MKKLLKNLLYLLLNLFKSLATFGLVVGCGVLVWFAFQPGFFNHIGLIKPDIIRIGVVRPFGAAGLIHQNAGFEANDKSSFFQNYGFQVQIVPLNNESHGRDMLLADSIDILNMSTATFARDADTLLSLQPQLAFLAGWSRGNDALIVRKDIRGITGLFELPVAYVPKTSQSAFLKWLLKWSGLEQDEIEAIEVKSEEEAMEAFVNGKSQAVVLSNAHVDQCIQLVSGDAKVLQTTSTASHILDHSYWIPKAFYEDHETKVAQLIKDWLKGNILVRTDEQAQKSVVKLLGKQEQLSPVLTGNFLQNTYLTGYRDNKNFLGVAKHYAGVRAKEIYEHSLVDDVFSDSLQQNQRKIRNYEVVIDSAERKLFNIQKLALHARWNKRRLYAKQVSLNTLRNKKLAKIPFKKIPDFQTQAWQIRENGYYLTYNKLIKDANEVTGYRLERQTLNNIANISFSFDPANGIVATYQAMSINERKLKPVDFHIKIDSTLRWNTFINTKPLLAFELVGEHHLAERIEYRTQSIQNSQMFRELPSIASYQLEVQYPKESIRLPVAAKGQLDEDFLLMAKIFGKCMIRIEAKADEWTDQQRNDYFAYKRAEAVSNYLVSEHKFNPRRFIILGNDTLSSNHIANSSTDYIPSHWVELALLGEEVE